MLLHMLKEMLVIGSQGDLDWGQLKADRRQAGDCCCAVSCSTAGHHLCPSLGTAGACNTIQPSRTPHTAAWLAEKPDFKSASSPSGDEPKGHLMRLVMLMYAGGDDMQYWWAGDLIGKSWRNLLALQTASVAPPLPVPARPAAALLEAAGLRGAQG